MDSGIAQFIPLILIFVIFYFFLIRPQQKKVKDHKLMVENLKRGDKVITSGGIIGTIERIIDAEKAEVSISDNVKVEVVKATGIQALVSGQSEAAYVNDPQGAYYINKNNAPFEMGFGGNNANRLAIATLKANDSLANAILSALEKMRADGSYTRIVDKWGLAAVPEFILNPS